MCFFEGEGGEEGDGGGGEDVQQTAVGEASPAAQVKILDSGLLLLGTPLYAKMDEFSEKF